MEPRIRFKILHSCKDVQEWYLKKSCIINGLSSNQRERTGPKPWQNQELLNCCRIRVQYQSYVRSNCALSKP